MVDTCLIRLKFYLIKRIKQKNGVKTPEHNLNTSLLLKEILDNCISKIHLAYASSPKTLTY